MPLKPPQALAQAIHAAPEAMLVHRDPIHRPKRPTLWILDDRASRQSSEEAEQHLLDGIIGLLDGQAESPCEAEQRLAVLFVDIDDDPCQRCGWRC